MSTPLIEQTGSFVFQPLLEKGVLAVFSNRSRDFLSDANIESDERKVWADFCNEVKAPVERIAHFKQVHGDRIIHVNESFQVPGFPRSRQVREEADAGMTNLANQPMVVFTADCGPVFFYDQKKRAVAIAHIGWKGSRLKLGSKVVREMNRVFKTNPSDLWVGFGPLIRSCCYEVGPEFHEFFPKETTKRGSQNFFDLPKSIENDLVAAGISSKQILDSGFCTACDPEKRFFSYRKEKNVSSRLCSLIMLID